MSLSMFIIFCNMLSKFFPHFQFSLVCIRDFTQLLIWFPRSHPQTCLLLISMMHQLLPGEMAPTCVPPEPLGEAASLRADKLYEMAMSIHAPPFARLIPRASHPHHSVSKARLSIQHDRRPRLNNLQTPASVMPIREQYQDVYDLLGRCSLSSYRKCLEHSSISGPYT